MTREELDRFLATPQGEEVAVALLGALVEGLAEQLNCSMPGASGEAGASARASPAAVLSPECSHGSRGSV